MKRMLVALATSILLAAPLPALAGPSGEQGNAKSQNVEWYLALGDSLAAGYQPGAGDDLKGGYAGGVLDGLKADWTKTKLVNLACTGETSTEMIVGGDCAYDEGSQLAAAVQFLKAHKSKVSLVTIDIGANDYLQCVHVIEGRLEIVPGCLEVGSGQVVTNLPTILSALNGAAHPDTQIVVANYYNPLVVAPPLYAELSGTLVTQLNGYIDFTAANEAVVAHVDIAFDVGDPLLAAARICAWTYMCEGPPLGPDIHPNDDGYAAMAQAILAVVDAPE
ncbi:SGNH/GDSL hydrolase family protein [Ornithinimicrobium sp. LYQ121]|uniref:SGNH/GDSL hydrolase family protein n=1 Tax=Ornithinimicrobium sp. LYQ121 TaxID=3378801 RepID=UPI0038545B86